MGVFCLLPKSRNCSIVGDGHDAGRRIAWAFGAAAAGSAGVAAGGAYATGAEANPVAASAAVAVRSDVSGAYAARCLGAAVVKVVSFFAPRPEHPYFHDYKPYLALLRESCAKFGHEHLVLTDDASVADDAYVCDLPRSLMKAVLAAQHAYLADPANANTPTLLVGADCVLARDPSAFAEHDADLVITVGDFADCRMNTGAIFVPKPCLVAEIWAEALAHVGDEWGDDQTSLYRAINERPWHGMWTAKVVELPVDPYNLAPEYPGEDCTRGVVLHFRGPRKRWMADYCHQWLGIGEGVQLEISTNTSSEEMSENVRSCMLRGLPLVQTTAEHDGHAVLVGGGPSAAATLPEIRWRYEHGQTIFGLNGAAQWLADNGIPPQHGVILDPRAKNAEFLDRRVGKWLLASQCSPIVFNRAERLGIEPTAWHFMDSADAQIQVSKQETPFIIGGNTVGLTAMGLVFAMGYRKLHLYGYDSSIAEATGENHAYEQAESDAEAMRLEVWSGARRFFVSPGMYAQVRAFPEWAALLANAGATITVHGDGLLPSVARQMHAATLVSTGELAA